MARTYEEIRTRAIGFLKKDHARADMNALHRAIDDSFKSDDAGAQRMAGTQSTRRALSPTSDILSADETVIFLDVFWDLIREGVITPGLNMQNAGLPWFHISAKGRALLATL